MFDNYRITYTSVAEAYIVEGKPDSASYWLDQARKDLPFETLKDDDGNSISRFAIYYIKAGDNEKAYEFIKDFEPEINQALEDAWNSYDQAFTDLENLQQEINQARRNAEMSKARELSKQAEIFTNHVKARQDIMRNAVGRILVLQHVYFKNGKDDEAQASLDFMEQLSPDLVKNYPSTKEENYNQVNRLF
jgi:hypothetical protein